MEARPGREVWAWVPGLEGKYEVSSFGQVKSVERLVTDANGKTRHYGGVVLVQSTDDSGYPCVSIDGTKTRVHRLVASAFCEQGPGNGIVDHIDGDKANNHAENLEWVSQAENNRRAYATGLKPRPFRNRYRASFTDDQVRKIRADMRSSTAIAKEYGVTDQAIRNIKKFKSYKEVI